MTPRALCTFFLALCAAPCLLLACLSSEALLRQRAASDFQCPPEQLAVRDASSGVYEVAGCDQKGRYVYSSDAQAWLRESESGGDVIR